ncbi:MAG: NAD(+) synthase [Clostridia bacterium]|nr:NAD(+) synthase [Clostridia bacterium]
MDCKKEVEKRVAFIKDLLKKTGAKGIVFGNSGGKDCALVGILCKMACENTLSIMMPCQSKQNYGSDMEDAKKVCEKFNIDYKIIDLTEAKNQMVSAISGKSDISHSADVNIAPRLRMTTLYTIGQSMGYLVAGTGNKCEIFMGYFTKWGDGGSDFNVVSDLYVSEVYELLRYLEAPLNIIEKAPSAGLFEGQTDEKEMGVTYAQIEEYIKTGNGPDGIKEKIARANAITAHKRRMPLTYAEGLE